MNELPNVDGAITYVIKHYFPYSSVPYADMYQAAYIGYLTAQKNYKPEFGPMSLKYSQHFMRYEIGKLMHNVLKQDKNLFYVEEQHEIAVQDEIQVDVISSALTVLKERDKDIITGLYLMRTPMTLKQLGEYHGISQERTRQLKDQAIKRMQDVYKFCS